jgi:hypothetical protein
MSVYHVQETPEHEHLYASANMSEANWLMGVACKFTPCTDYFRDINSDPHPTYDETTYDINIHFDDNPKALLRSLNWLSEGEELPYVAYISNIIYPKFREFKKSCKEQGLNVKEAFDKSFNDDGTPSDTNNFYMIVSRYSLLELPYKMDVVGTQKFWVTDIQGDSVNPFIWICKLAPYREQVDVDPTTEKVDSKRSDDFGKSVTGNIYLNV